MNAKAWIKHIIRWLRYLGAILSWGADLLSLKTFPEKGKFFPADDGRKEPGNRQFDNQQPEEKSEVDTESGGNVGSN